jgi:hypothetical protein
MAMGRGLMDVVQHVFCAEQLSVDLFFNQIRVAKTNRFGLFDLISVISISF